MIENKVSISLTHVQLFNGDFVDRGSFSVECILTIFSFKLLYPNHFFLARGKCSLLLKHIHKIRRYAVPDTT